MKHSSLVIFSLTISIFNNDLYYYACYLHEINNIIKEEAQLFPQNISKFQVVWLIKIIIIKMFGTQQTLVNVGQAYHFLLHRVPYLK